MLRIPREAIVDAEWIDNGPGWLGIMLDSADAVLALDPLGSCRRRVDIGVIGPHPEGAETAFEIRVFFSNHLGTIVEDPVTGSLNASAAQWLFASGRVAGAATSRRRARRSAARGRIFVERDEAGEIWIGGKTRTLFEGDGIGF